MRKTTIATVMLLLGAFSSNAIKHKKSEMQSAKMVKNLIMAESKVGSSHTC